MSHNCDLCMGFDPYVCRNNPEKSGPWFVVTSTMVRPSRGAGTSRERAWSIAKNVDTLSLYESKPHITTRPTRYPR